MGGENGWELVPLGKLTQNFDSVRVPVKQSDRRAGPYPYYGASGVVDHVEGYLFEGEYLLVAEDGENLRTRQTPVAFLAYGRFWVNNHAHIVQGNDRASTRFLSYALSQTDISGYLTGSTIPKLTQGNMNRIPVRTPPRPIQDAIAHILGTLDEKIELNRRMNETLEGIARAVFKSWFVDFDPVRAKLDGRQPPGMDVETAALFPDGFEDSELGKVPKGWRIESVGDHVELQRGKTYKSGLKGQPGPYLLGLGSIERNGGFRSGKLVTYGGDSPQNLLVYPGDIYVSLKDVTQSADLLGAVAKVPSWIKVGRMTQDTVKLVFRPNSLSRNLIYRTLLGPDYREHCKSHATGTTNLGLSRDDFLGYPLLVPTQEVQHLFDRLVNQLEGKADVCVRESQTLSSLRETLLPKLLSGEIRVGEAADMVGEG